MSRIVKNTVIVAFIIFAGINIYLFVAGMYLSDDINKFDNATHKLAQENIQLENQVSQAESLEYAASLSAALKFNKKAQPIFFDNLKYALNR